MSDARNGHDNLSEQIDSARHVQHRSAENSREDLNPTRDTPGHAPDPGDGESKEPFVPPKAPHPGFISGDENPAKPGAIDGDFTAEPETKRDDA